jgi:acetylornithine deacetylase/succinyl-diaminopimelate desuccinylase-like protein
MTTLAGLLEMVDDARDEIIALTQALVRIPTVNTGKHHEPPWPPSGKLAPGEPYPVPIVPYDASGDSPTGDELPAAELLRDTLAAEGIGGRILLSGEGRGNFYTSLGTAGAQPKLLFMSHLDVVPVEDPRQWRYPPFDGLIAEGRLWGRGASDMKSTAAAQAMALIILQRAGVRLHGELAFLASADEESGSAYGCGWLVQHYPELVRADYAVNEGTDGPLRTPSGKLLYPIGPGEKGRLEARIHITGRGYHSSQPWRANNAIYIADDVLQRIRAYEPAISLDADIFRYLELLAGIREPVTAENIDRIVADVTEVDVTLGSYLRAASRMTLVASMLQAGVKVNSVAETALITCDVRTLPHQDTAFVQREFEIMLAGIPGVEVEVIQHAAATVSSFDHPFAEQVMAAARHALGRDDLLMLPSIDIGGTDSHFARSLGAIAYGFVPGHPDGDPSLAGWHNIDESCDLRSLVSFTRYFVALAWETLVARS